ncbi:MAG: glycosyltransferase family 39 protein, partial [Acidobacteriota bacterium]
MTRASGWLTEQLRQITASGDPNRLKLRPKQLFATCLLVFFVALGVRLLTWHDLRQEVWKVQTYVTSDYKYSAYLLARHEFKTFLTDLNRLGHPPGYPIVLAGIFKVLGDSDGAVQLVQIFCDSIAAVLLFLIAFELLPVGAAIIAGLLAAFSPQFSYHAVLVLPDSLAVLPILIAIYLIVRARRPRLLTFALAGVFLGLSCWLRANALLLAPFLAVVLMLLFQEGQRLRFATALIAGVVLTIAPITIKNYIVFHHFVPLSLGAGQTLLEGISDYDKEGRFNIPLTDLGIMRQEAEWYHKPEYALLLFGQDGIQRERMRTARGFAAIRSRPVWFLGVMGRRGMASLKLDRVPIVSPEAPVAHALSGADRLQPIWTKSPTDLIAAAGGIASNGTHFELVDGGHMLRLVGDASKYGNQIVSSPIAVERDRDYVVRLPLKLEEGRALVKVVDADDTRVLASIVIDLAEGVAPTDQALQRLEIPFVSGNFSTVRLVLANNASTPGPPVARMGQAEVFELGPSAYQWTRYPRSVVRNLQRVFLTAWMLPLATLGILIMLRARRGRTAVILLSVPLYYLIFQSALHTERRYVIAIHY